MLNCFKTKSCFPVVFWMGLWVATATAQGGLTPSELLFQPRSGEAEYVELYNPTDGPVNLADYHIVRWIGDTLGSHYPLPIYIVAPHDFVVLTKDATSVATQYAVKRVSKLVECDLPPYPNGGGTLILATAEGEVVERLDYTPLMHSPLLRNKNGVAIERRSFERPCNEVSNWFSASSTAGYGTPTYANSQSTELLAEETAFSLSTTLLSPNGDGYEDGLTIGYELAEEGLYAQMEVYDAHGNRVARLANNALLGTHGEVGWDGHGDGGAILPMGRYVLYINLYDQHGTRQVIKRTVSIVY